MTETESKLLAHLRRVTHTSQPHWDAVHAKWVVDVSFPGSTREGQEFREVLECYLGSPAGAAGARKGEDLAADMARVAYRAGVAYRATVPAAVEDLNGIGVAATCAAAAEVFIEASDDLFHFLRAPDDREQKSVEQYRQERVG